MSTPEEEQKRLAAPSPDGTDDEQLQLADNDRPHPDAPPQKKPRPIYKPVQPIPPEKKSPIGRVLVVLLLLGLGFGGYYAFCRYEVANKIWEMEKEVQHIKNDLALLNRNIGPEDVKKIALEMAKKAGVEANPDHIAVYIAKLDSQNVSRLPPVQAHGFQIAESAIPTQQNIWVVGFEGRFLARSGICTKYFITKRYTWFQLVGETTE